MNNFYVWIGVLIDSYEHVISEELLSLGYTIAPIDGALIQNKLISYKLSHKDKNQDLYKVEKDLDLIIDKRKLKCHSCVVIVPYTGGFNARWFGSNIPNSRESDATKETVPPKPKPLTDGSQVDDVVAHMHRIIDDNCKSIRAQRHQCLN